MPTKKILDLLLRAALLGPCMLTSMLVLLSPSSTSARLVLDWPEFGRLLALAMCVAVLVGFLDILVNDLLPTRKTLPACQRYRWLGFLLLGLIYAIFIALAGFGRVSQGKDVLIFGYAYQAFMCVAYSCVLSASRLKVSLDEKV